jgi:hypothetical protein
MHMQSMDAPDIRWSALTAHEEAGEEGEGHGDEHGDYDLETFRLAVVEGRHPDGERLDEDMPRWEMSTANVGELADYLQSLP